MTIDKRQHQNKAKQFKDLFTFDLFQYLGHDWRKINHEGHYQMCIWDNDKNTVIEVGEIRKMSPDTVVQ